MPRKKLYVPETLREVIPSNRDFTKFLISKNDNRDEVINPNMLSKIMEISSKYIRSDLSFEWHSSPYDPLVVKTRNDKLAHDLSCKDDKQVYYKIKFFLKEIATIPNIKIEAYLQNSNIIQIDKNLDIVAFYNGNDD